LAKERKKMIDTLLKYINFIENEGIETSELYELCGFLYTVIGELKVQNKTISDLMLQIQEFKQLLNIDDQ
jgi:hypothetical protein